MKSKKLQQKNPLEEALKKLDLQGTLVLMNLLTQRALSLQLESTKATEFKSSILHA